MQTLLGKSYEEICEICKSLNFPTYVGKQISEWLYIKKVSSFEQMHNVNKKVIGYFSSQWQIGRRHPIDKYESDDGTIKYIFEVCDNVSAFGTEKKIVEAVYIPDGNRKTICVSTQIGCRMGCKFCMTATLGFKGNLSVADILNQIFAIMEAQGNKDEANARWNVVFMGEGEPLDNFDNVLKTTAILTTSNGCAWSPTRITLSTVGITPFLVQWLTQTKCHLALSLHSPFDKERRTIIPAQNKYPLQDIISTLQTFDFSHQRKLFIEYIVWRNFNDSEYHIKNLAQIGNKTHAKINLISYHKAFENESKISLMPVSTEKLVSIQAYLNKLGVTATIRKSRGEDIWAACGMLVQHHHTT